MFWAFRLICLFGHFFKKCYVHDIFTTNPSWQLLLVLIYISLKLFFCSPITIYHLEFVMKVLWTCCEHNIFHNFLVNLQWTKILEKSNFIFNGQILFRMFRIFLGWSSFFSKLSITYINGHKFFFFQVESGPVTTLNYTWRRQWSLHSVDLMSSH